MEEGIWILCGILLFVVILLAFFYVFRKRQVEKWKKQSRGDLITKPQGKTPSRFKGLRASFSNATLQVPRGKWRPSGGPQTDLSTTDAPTPPALKEARRQMSQDESKEQQQNEENTIQVDISSVAYSKYKQLVYEENGFVNVDLNENESVGSESGCVSATPCSTPGSIRSDINFNEQPGRRKHSETEI